MRFSLQSSLAVLLVLQASHAAAFSAPVSSSNGKNGIRSFAPLSMSLDKYADELRDTANRMVRPGYGLLACDESTGTVGTRLESIGLENTEENRQVVRVFMFTNRNLVNATFFCSTHSHRLGLLVDCSGVNSYSPLPI
jgi:fructose-bisphosphate aldolase class I